MRYAYHDLGEQPRGGTAIVRWRGPEQSELIDPGKDTIFPGDTLVVPAAYGGADRFGWSPQTDLRVREMLAILVLSTRAAGHQ